MREREEGEVQEARQRASIKWLVAKAYNNSPPRECVDPFYRDYKDVERLKPHLVHALGELLPSKRVISALTYNFVINLSKFQEPLLDLV